MTTTTSHRLRHQIQLSGDAPEITESDISDLEAEMEKILMRIAAKPSALEAATELDELGEFHGLLAVLLFKHRIPLSERQKKVVRVFDRWDDDETRTYFHKEVVAGRI